MKKPVFTGAGVAIVTPFKADGSVHYEEFGRMLDHQIANNTDAIIVAGTTGESPTLPDREHRELVEFTCNYVAGRIPVIAGAGSNHTDYAVELTRHAKACGADAVLSVTPYYNKSSQRGLVAHYMTIADAVDIPCILYNVPSRTGIGFTADSCEQLSKHPNINGIKEASGDFSLLAQIIQQCGDDMNVWSGNDDQIVPLMAMGGKGVISVLSNVAPQQTHDLCQLCMEGNFAEAMKLQMGYLPLINSLFCEVNPIPVKKAMEVLGWDVGALRLPLLEVEPKHDALIRAEIAKMGCKI